MMEHYSVRLNLVRVVARLLFLAKVSPPVAVCVSERLERATGSPRPSVSRPHLRPRLA